MPDYAFFTLFFFQFHPPDGQEREERGKIGISEEKEGGAACID